MTGLSLLTLWGVLVALGMFGMVRYQMTPAVNAGEIPSRWPVRTAIARASDRPTLLMFLHPKCPCSMASLHELEQLLSRCNAPLDTKLFFVEPLDAPADWNTQSNLMKAALSLHGVTVLNDEGGKIAEAFGATTSGQVAIYDTAGKLLFHGGITDGRGHQGDNAGLDAAITLVRGEQSTPSSSAVYGCSLGVCSLKDSGQGEQ